MTIELSKRMYNRVYKEDSGREMERECEGDGDDQADIYGRGSEKSSGYTLLATLTVSR